MHVKITIPMYINETYIRNLGFNFQHFFSKFKNFEKFPNLFKKIYYFEKVTIYEISTDLLYLEPRILFGIFLLKSEIILFITRNIK